MTVDKLLEKDLKIDFLIRMGIRQLLKTRLKNEKKATAELQQHHLMELIDELKSSPIAINTQDANAQHYEVPAEFYEIVLGPNLKYSSGYWQSTDDSIKESELHMLELTIERADIQNGQTVLDLGCGWGSFSLFAAEMFPNSDFIAVSNSNSQRKFIENRASEKGLKNLKVYTADINEFHPTGKFDRIVSVEMFEHVRNYEMLFSRIHSWLKKEGKLFVHIFTHHSYAYKFEVETDKDWMAKYFFSGGMMPSDSLLFYFSEKFKIGGHWNVDGTHYSKTLEAWLERMDENKVQIMRLFKDVYGDEATKFWAYWRIFFMACSETFTMNNGREWGVSHYLFEKI
jgi:cyclopropane-fatty-acyl-phospholipid synthase